jgi:phosphate transport system substrate-binding protein
MAPNDSLKLLGVNGVVPGYTSLKNKEYIYTTEVFAVIREDLDKSSYAFKLYNWIKTAEGQGVVSKTGYIPYYTLL